jgi:hypothetical protein
MTLYLLLDPVTVEPPPPTIFVLPQPHPDVGSAIAVGFTGLVVVVVVVVVDGDVPLPDVEVEVEVDVEVVVVVTGFGVTVVVQLVGRNVSESSVTAPLRANTRPSTVTPVVTVADVRAISVPTKVELVPSVAELPTCQKTLHAWAPFSRTTLLLDAVTTVEPAWKMKSALGLPAPFSVTVPVSIIELAEV